MLLSITDRCHMGCIHCSENATPDGRHMEDVIFGQAVNFIKKVKPKIILLSGGEPTEHPKVIDYINILKSIGHVMLLSNGMFVHDPVLLKEVMDTGIPIQITNDKRYYPKPLGKRIQCDRVTYETKIRSLSKFGRAIDNWDLLEKPDYKRKCPSCFNFRSVCASFEKQEKYELAEVVRFMEFEANKFCQPKICTNGDIVAGEHNVCFKVGHVFDYTWRNIIYNAAYMKCNKCGEEDLLNIIAKKHINL